jgi:hypothetical protein
MTISAAVSDKQDVTQDTIFCPSTAASLLAVSMFTDFPEQTEVRLEGFAI